MQENNNETIEMPNLKSEVAGVNNVPFDEEKFLDNTKSLNIPSINEINGEGVVGEIQTTSINPDVTLNEQNSIVNESAKEVDPILENLNNTNINLTEPAYTTVGIDNQINMNEQNNYTATQNSDNIINNEANNLSGIINSEPALDNQINMNEQNNYTATQNSDNIINNETNNLSGIINSEPALDNQINMNSTMTPLESNVNGTPVSEVNLSNPQVNETNQTVENKNEVKEKKSNKLGTFLLVLMCIIIVASLAVVGYFWYNELFMK